MKELTLKQQEFFDKLFLSCQNHKIDLYSSEKRAWGKTTIINELGFTLQALGYTVYILTPYRNQEYCGEKFVSLDSCDFRDFRGIPRDNIVILADEVRISKITELIKFCDYHNIAVVGFVDYEIPIIYKEIGFKKEYKCEWIN